MGGVQGIMAPSVSYIVNIGMPNPADPATFMGQGVSSPQLISSACPMKLR